MKAISVIEGDSTDVIVIRHRVNGTEVTDYSNYTMTVKVLNEVTKEVKINKELVYSADVNGYKVMLLPSETEELGKGGYLIVGNLSKTENGVMTFHRQLVWGLNIESSVD